MRHAVYSALNKPRLLFGVEYRIVLLAGAAGLPILAFAHGRASLVVAFAVPVGVFAAGAMAYRSDPQFLAVFLLASRLHRRYDAGKR
jgi:type IV secretory pathway TrbD component